MQLSHILFYRGALRGYLAPAARLVLAMFAADVEERARICVETVEPGKKKKKKKVRLAKAPMFICFVTHVFLKTVAHCRELKDFAPKRMGLVECFAAYLMRLASVSV